jgi:hypothetical protein
MMNLAAKALGIMFLYLSNLPKRKRKPFSFYLGWGKKLPRNISVAFPFDPFSQHWVIWSRSLYREMERQTPVDSTRKKRIGNDKQQCLPCRNKPLAAGRDTIDLNKKF